MTTESIFTHHEACPNCQAEGKDLKGNNLARYDDGHGYCFACGFYDHPEGIGHISKGTATDESLLDVGDFVQLSKRNLTAETLKKFGYSLGVHHNQNVHIAPYYDDKGRLVAQHIRYGKPKDFRWKGEPKKAMLFGQQLWRNGGRRVVITEGELDCMSISQMQNNSWPVVSIKSGSSGAKKDLLQQLEWLEGFQQIVLCFDMDEAGQKAALECAELFTPGKACIVHLPEKDASDCLQKGKGKELISACWEAKPYRPDGIINGQDLLAECKEPPASGASIPFPRLDEYIMGIRSGELYLFTAGSGVGKSTLVREISYHLHQEHKWPLGIIALEESKAKTARTYVGLDCNKPLQLPGVTIPDDQFEASFSRTVGRGDWWLYDHWGSTDVDGLLGKIRYMAKGLGIKCLVLDHISIVVSGLEGDAGDNERKTIDVLMTKLRSLVQETNICVLAVVHVKRPKDGKSYNEGRHISLTDLRGSGSLEQLSDVVIAMTRDQQGDTPNVSSLHVLKNRPIGTTGAAGKVVWSPETGRLTPCDDDGEAVGDNRDPFEVEDEDEFDF